MPCPLCDHPNGHTPDCRLDGATTDEFITIIEELIEQRNAARYEARILAHAYTTDNRPPDNIVRQALTYDVDQRLPKDIHHDD